MEPEVTPQIRWIPYNSEAEALAKIAAIDEKYRKPWEQRSTETYATPLERIDGQFYLPIFSWTWEDFSAEERARGVEGLPEALPNEETL